MGLRPRSVAEPAVLVDPSADPTLLPPPGDAGRWSWLQRLRRGALDMEPWLVAIETGRLAPEPDLLAVLADRLDAAAVVRLLRWWRHQLRRLLVDDVAGSALPGRICRLRDAAVAMELRSALAADEDPALRPLLLPLLGHQRCEQDFGLLRRAALDPAPLAVRRAALEGLCLGLSAWPLADLRATLLLLAGDLDVTLAAAAVDALARLPQGRTALLRLRGGALDPAVAARLERRLAALPASPLLLLVHGRGAGAIPLELQELAGELQRRRGAPVLLRALTDPRPAALPTFDQPLWLVPLLLLPGEHVRQDLPRLRRELRRQLSAGGGLRALPFLGSWPAWQQALAAELSGLAAAAAWPRARPPLLLHHPLRSPLAHRYLAHLSAITGASCREAAYSPETALDCLLNHPGPVLPLTLAANRLTEALTPRLAAAAAPLLTRPGLRQMLLQRLEALP